MFPLMCCPHTRGDTGMREGKREWDCTETALKYQPRNRVGAEWGTLMWVGLVFNMAPRYRTLWGTQMASGKSTGEQVGTQIIYYKMLLLYFPLIHCVHLWCYDRASFLCEQTEMLKCRRRRRRWAWRRRCWVQGNWFCNSCDIVPECNADKVLLRARKAKIMLKFFFYRFWSSNTRCMRESVKIMITIWITTGVTSTVSLNRVKRANRGLPFPAHWSIGFVAALWLVSLVARL